MPVVRARLVESSSPITEMMATVKLEEGQELKNLLLLEATHRFAEIGELQFGNTLVYPTEDRCAKVLLTNPTDFTQKLERCLWVGRASEAAIIKEDHP